MTESHYSPREENELVLVWGNELALRDPKLAEDLMKGLVEGEEDGEKTS